MDQKSFRISRHDGVLNVDINIGDGWEQFVEFHLWTSTFDSIEVDRLLDQLERMGLTCDGHRPDVDEIERWMEEDDV